MALRGHAHTIFSSSLNLVLVTWEIPANLILPRNKKVKKSFVYTAVLTLFVYYEFMSWYDYDDKKSYTLLYLH